jgi:hypothetical protein
MARKRQNDIPNCWEFLNCQEEVCRTCPAYPDHGHECWKVTGTKCESGKYVKANSEEKILHCRNECNYYRTYLKNTYP